MSALKDSGSLQYNWFTAPRGRVGLHESFDALGAVGVPGFLERGRESVSEEDEFAQRRSIEPFELVIYRLGYGL